MGLPERALEQKKRRVEAAAEDIAQGCEETRKFLCCLVKTKIALAIIYSVNMQLGASLTPSDLAMIEEIKDDLGEEAAKCLFKLNVR